VSRARPGELRLCALGCGTQVTVHACPECADRMWDTARAIARIVQGDPYGGLPEYVVQQQAGEWGAAMWKQAKFAALRKGWIQFGSEQARGYMFGPTDDSPCRTTRRRAPQPPPCTLADPCHQESCAGCYPDVPAPAERLVEVPLVGGAVLSLACRDGRVADVAGAGDAYDWLRGLPEAEAAAKLRALGARRFRVVAR